MAKGVDNHEFDDILSADFTPEELEDRRRRSKAPPELVVGSREYWQWWRENNRERSRLYQRRAYLSRRKAALAMQKYTEDDAKTLEDAMEEVNEQIAILREVNSHNVAETRKKVKALAAASPSLPAINPDEIPFVREMADIYKIDYAVAMAIMSREDYRGDDTFCEVLGLPKP